MKNPKRIQRKRSKGWRMPPNTVYVGRGSKWGNPFKVFKEKTGGYSIRKMRVRPFKQEIEAINYSVKCYRDRKARYFPPSWLDELKGKNLACWCRLDSPCHVDVLLGIANGRIIEVVQKEGL